MVNLDTYPKISVITASYNQGEFIGQTIESVLAQNYPNFEHIIIDGVSTDNTIKILESYPHLDWISEPDDGQTSALNKGFNKASGEIIAWINSDDWYEPGTFEVVAQHLKNHPIVMGQAAITDRQGNIDYVVPNYERGWFEMLKYWIPYSIPTQPSIFFRRELLPLVLGGRKEYLDNELYMCMDYDLWMRIAELYPFALRDNRIFAHYRMYEDNKSGKEWSISGPEMARIFRRSVIRKYNPERKFSVIIPLTDEGLPGEVFASLEGQVFKDAEIVLVGKKGGDAEAISASLFNFPWVSSRARLVTNDSQDLTFWELGAKHAVGENLVFLNGNWKLSSQALLSAAQHFEENSTGLLIGFSELTSKTYVEPNESAVHIEKVFSAPFEEAPFIIRRAAWDEVCSSIESLNPALALKEIMLGAVIRGWNVKISEGLRPEKSPSSPTNLLESLRDRVNAELILQVDALLKSSPFHNARIGSILPQNLVEQSKTFLSNQSPGNQATP